MAKRRENIITSADSLIVLEATKDPCSFRLGVTNDICVGPPGNVFLFGGAGFSAAIMAMKLVARRELICASAQFLSYARVGAVLDLAVATPVGGRNVSQLSVVARLDEAIIFTVTGAFGARSGQPEHQWLAIPQMPSPEDCIVWPIWPKQGAGLNERLELRLEAGGPGTYPRDGRIDAEGRMRMWVRTLNDAPVDAATLALFADFVPAAAAAALGRVGGGNSLDNCLRLRTIVPTRWVLCDMQMSGADRGFGHGEVRLFAEDGTLMATGGQSIILRHVSTDT